MKIRVNSLNPFCFKYFLKKIKNIILDLNFEKIMVNFYGIINLKKLKYELSQQKQNLSKDAISEFNSTLPSENNIDNKKIK